MNEKRVVSESVAEMITDQFQHVVIRLDPGIQDITLHNRESHELAHSLCFHIDLFLDFLCCKHIRISVKFRYPRSDVKPKNDISQQYHFLVGHGRKKAFIDPPQIHIRNLSPDRLVDPISFFKICVDFLKTAQQGRLVLFF